MLRRAKFFCFPQKIERAVILFIFWPILLKLHISVSEMDSFLTPFCLSNSSEEKLQFTPFGGGPKSICSDGLRTGIIESHNFLS